MKSVFAPAMILAGVLASGSLAQAATLSESSDYSSVAANPTVVGTGYDTVSGSLFAGNATNGWANDVDFLAVSLGSTATSVTLNFSLADTSYGNNATYGIAYSYSPFVGAWYSNSAARDQYNNPVKYNVETVLLRDDELSSWSGQTSNSYSIAVDPTLGDTLYLSLIRTGGNGVADYNVSGFADASASIPAVPLPAGGLLLLSALGTGFAWRRRKAA